MEASKIRDSVSFEKRDIYCPFIFWSRPKKNYEFNCRLQPSNNLSDLEDTVFVTPCNCFLIIDLV